MHTFCKLAAIAAIVSAVGLAAAAETVIVGFNSVNNLANTAPAGQSCNYGATRSVAFNADTAYITEGTASSAITSNWLVDGTQIAYSDKYYQEITENHIYWSMRNDFSAATPISAAYDGVKIDIYNASASAMTAAICVHDGNYRRSPFTTLAPGWNTLTWDFSAVAPAGIGWVNWDTTPLNRASLKFRGVLFYTTTAPVNDVAVPYYVDNFRGYSNQSDTNPPTDPKLLSVGQGSAPGKLKLNWETSTDAEGQVVKYTVKILAGNAFVNNRINYSTILKSVDFTGAAVTTGEVDLDTEYLGVPVYAFVTATDNATPTPNESSYTCLLGAILNADGSATKDTVVLDMKRYDASSQSAVIYGYPRAGAMIPYYARAWAAFNGGARSFSSQIADTALPAAKADGAVVYVNAVDGNDAASAITEANAAKINAYVAAGGKLLMSGSRYGLGLSLSTGTEQLALLANTLKVSTVTDVAAGRLELNGAVAYTSGDAYYYSPGYSSNNVALVPASGATAAGELKSADGTTSFGSACVYYGNKVAALGFSLDLLRLDPATGTVYDNANDTMRGSVAKQFIDYMIPAASVADWSQF